MQWDLSIELKRRIHISIVRTEGRSQQRYYTDKRWVESSVMIKYFNDESPYYGSYSEITEEEANKLIAGM